jgi:hypothetical protein
MAYIVPEGNDDLVEQVARFLLNWGYGIDMVLEDNQKPPVVILEKMVELAADDPTWFDQNMPREERLDEAYLLFTDSLGYWRADQ